MGMLAEAAELFARVDVKSIPGRDAGLWLDELSTINAQDNKAILGEELPGFCKNLIPSEGQVQEFM